MTDKKNEKEKKSEELVKKLNAILKLRLFYSTKKEYCDNLDLKSLGSNKFNKLKNRPFVCDAYYSQFIKECNEATDGKVDLEDLLLQYECTSKFFVDYIKGTAHETKKAFISPLLNYIYMDEKPDDTVQPRKNIIEKYESRNKKGHMNIGILILLTYGLMPPLSERMKDQDVENINADFQKAYEILAEIAQSHQSGNIVDFEGHPGLAPFREIEERASKENITLNRNRIHLIDMFNFVLDHIFVFKKPEKLLQTLRDLPPIELDLQRLWHRDNDPDNVVWEIVPFPELKGFLLFRNEIDKNGKEVRFTKYQLWGGEECATIIYPSCVWHTVLRKKIPNDSYSSVFIRKGYSYKSDKRIVKTIDFFPLLDGCFKSDKELDDELAQMEKRSFDPETDFGKKPIRLTAVEGQDYLDYYEKRLSEELGYEFVDTQPEYAVHLYPLKVSVSDDTILFKIYDSNHKNYYHKLDKYDENGNETIPGISSLTHDDNFVLVEMMENGIERYFLGLDSIGMYIDVEDLDNQPYFHEIKNIDEMF